MKSLQLLWSTTMTSVEQALSYVSNGQVLGLGTGRAATAFIVGLGERVRVGLRIKGVPTSQASADLAAQMGIPLTSLAEVESIDIAFDGADEVDPCLRLIKGYGGALVREKIVAAAAKRFVVLVGPDKLVDPLGSRGKLPVEVVPFGVDFVRRRLEEAGWSTQLRESEGRPFASDNGNMILDVALASLLDPDGLDEWLQSIPGVVDTGLFLGMADTVLIQHAVRVEIRTATPAKRTK